ncbi:Uncharacterized protein SCF082_LOCUS48051 [Durusdinium trenchii]|uniref:Uncharacterized protein n=1 Tax=Durusdinium trenchii TaxID=1381693 RepID=A0ABP0RTA4_9DINO
MRTRQSLTAVECQQIRDEIGKLRSEEEHEMALEHWGKSIGIGCMHHCYELAVGCARELHKISHPVTACQLVFAKHSNGSTEAELECLEAGCTNKTIYTEILPELVVWVGSMVDQHANCLTKGKGALVELPLLRTQGGNLKRKADQAAKQSKLGTLEGYGEICALSHALQAVGTNLMEFRPPKEILARPLKDGEARVYVEGQWRVVNRDGDVLPEYPPGFSFATLPTLITFSDQGPSNTAQKHPDEEEEEPFLDPLPGEDGQKREDYRKTLQEIKKKTGGWKLAPRMVTDRNLTVMDSMQWLCTELYATALGTAGIVWKKAGQPMPLPLAYCLTGNSILNVEADDRCQEVIQQLYPNECLFGNIFDLMLRLRLARSCAPLRRALAPPGEEPLAAGVLGRHFAKSSEMGGDRASLGVMEGAALIYLFNVKELAYCEAEASAPRCAALQQLLQRCYVWRAFLYWTGLGFSQSDSFDTKLVHSAKRSDARGVRSLEETLAHFDLIKPEEDPKDLKGVMELLLEEGYEELPLEAGFSGREGLDKGLDKEILELDLELLEEDQTMEVQEDVPEDEELIDCEEELHIN